MTAWALLGLLVAAVAGAVAWRVYKHETMAAKPTHDERT